MSHETREKKSFKHQVDEIVALIKKAISKNDLKTASTNLNKLI